jgi:2-polyprenyl-6-methoxyphenol hydroxylase-like FAD-dependent oxidoreductase
VPKEYGIGGLTAYGTLLGEHHYDWLQRELVRPFYFTDNERLPQYATEEVLRARAAELPPVEVLYGRTAEDIEQDREGVTIAASGKDGICASGPATRSAATAATRWCGSRPASARRVPITTG